MKKEFKTIKAQREYLVKEKNIIDDEIIERVLKERTYVSIVNTYKEFFYTNIANGSHIYGEKVDFREYINLAAIDDDISNKLHKYVGVFERKLKFVIAYEYSKYLSDEKKDPTCTEFINILTDINHLITNENSNNNSYTNFDDFLKKLGFIKINQEHSRKGILREINEKYKEKTIQYRKRLLNDVLLHSKQNEGVKKSEIIKHYIAKQELVPFWLLVHQLSLGDLAVLCGMFDATIRENIYKNYKGIEQKLTDRKKEVNKFFLQLDTIKNIRNTINHYEPLITKFKSFNVDKIKAALKLLKETYNDSIIANYKATFDLENIKDTPFNNKSKTILKTFIDILK